MDQSKELAKSLVGKWVGVPESFFGVEVEGARYLARVSLLHASKPQGPGQPAHYT